MTGAHCHPGRAHRDLRTLTWVSLALAVLGGCGLDRATSCSSIGAVSGVQFDYGAVARRHHGVLTVTACVDSSCTRVVRRPRPGTSTTLRAGQSALHGGSSVTTRLTIHDARGGVVFSGSAVALPQRNQPNGPGCPPTAWIAEVVATGSHDLSQHRLAGL